MPPKFMGMLLPFSEQFCRHEMFILLKNNEVIFYFDNKPFFLTSS